MNSDDFKVWGWIIGINLLIINFHLLFNIVPLLRDIADLLNKLVVGE